jgi:hypothetical protein
MFRCTSLVPPPAMVMARSCRNWRAQRLPVGRVLVVHERAPRAEHLDGGPENSCVSCVVTSFIAAERCGLKRPCTESLSARMPDQRTIDALMARPAIFCRTSGSSVAPRSRAAAMTPSSAWSKRMLPAMPVRSFTRALETISHPCPSAPSRLATGTRTSLMNTSLNSALPSIWRIGRTSTPASCP